MSFHIVKMGGSLISNARETIRLLGAEKDHGFLIIPGGGPMTDLVREMDHRLGIAEETAHWMAILAMEEYAYFLADGTGAGLTRSPIVRNRGVQILLPYQMLLEDDRGLDRDWDHTSDSVAALVAARMGRDFVKATDVDGVILDGRLVEEVWADELLGVSTCVDQGTIRMLMAGGGCCRVLNGSSPERFVSALLEGRSGTIIRGRGRSKPSA